MSTHYSAYAARAARPPMPSRASVARVAAGAGAAAFPLAEDAAVAAVVVVRLRAEVISREALARAAEAAVVAMEQIWEARDCTAGRM